MNSFLISTKKIKSLNHACNIPILHNIYAFLYINYAKWKSKDFFSFIVVSILNSMSLDNKKCLCWIHNHIPSDVTSKSRNSDSLSRYLRWILCEIVLYIVLLLLFLLLIWKQVMIVIGTYIKSNKSWKRKLIQNIGRCCQLEISFFYLVPKHFWHDPALKCILPFYGNVRW